MTNDITSRAHFPATFRHLFSTVGKHRNEIPSHTIVIIWLDTRFQIHGRKYQHSLIALVTEPGANSEYEAVDILGQAAKYCRVIHPIKMSFDS